MVFVLPVTQKTARCFQAIDKNIRENTDRWHDTSNLKLKMNMYCADDTQVITAFQTCIDDGYRRSRIIMSAQDVLAHFDTEMKTMKQIHNDRCPANRVN